MAKKIHVEICFGPKKVVTLMSHVDDQTFRELKVLSQVTDLEQELYVGRIYDEEEWKEKSRFEFAEPISNSEMDELFKAATNKVG